MSDDLFGALVAVALIAVVIWAIGSVILGDYQGIPIWTP